MRFLCFILLFLCSNAYSQWPSTPEDNLTICGSGGEQAQAKIVALENGSSYISWLDNRNGGYDVYMQRLDTSGNPMWQENGILIADRNYSWTMDYGITIDSEGNAVVVYRKEMLGGDGIVASSVSPDGTILWHQTLQTGVSFVASPVICTSSNHMYVGWIGNDDSKIQKLNNKGVMQWKTPTSMADPDGGFYFITDIHSSLNDGAIASFVQYMTFSGNKRLKAQRIKSDGSLAWSSQTNVMTSNSLQYGNYPDFIPDGDGGGFFAWYGVNPLQCYTTHISNAGFKWFAGEVQVASSAGSTERVEPVAVVDYNNHELVVFFRSLDNNQNSDGVGAQRFSENGALLWGDAGVVLKPTSSLQQYGSLAASMTNEGAVVVFTQSPSFGNDFIIAASIDQDGLPTWATNFINVATTPSNKSRIATASTADGMLLAWQDARIDPNDIYGQRVNADGTLGNTSNCGSDVNGDGFVGVNDLLDIISLWGDCPSSGDCNADVNDDGMVNVSDLLLIIDAWGPCP